MNRFVTQALTMAAVGSIGFAGGTDSEWSGLDQQLKKLNSSASLRAGGMGIDFGAQARTSFRGVSSRIAGVMPGSSPAAAGSGNVRRWTLDNANLWGEFTVGDLDARISLQGGQSPTHAGTAGNNAVGIDEAFADWNVAANGVVRWGVFPMATARSANYQDSKLLFVDRTFVANNVGADTAGTAGGNGGIKNAGVGYIGAAGDWDYAVAIQNGSANNASPTGTPKSGDQFLGSARVQWGLNGGVGAVQGAYGAPQETRVTIGVFGQLDSNYDGNMIVGLDAYGTHGPISWGVELASFDGERGGVANGSSSTPWDVWAGYQFGDNWEVAAMYEEHDPSGAGATGNKVTLGVNYYLSGHDAKWMVNVGTADYGNQADGQFLLAGLSVGANGGMQGPLGAGMTRND